MRWVWVGGSAAAACAGMAAVLYVSNLETLSWVAGAGSFAAAVPSLVLALVLARTPERGPSAPKWTGVPVRTAAADPHTLGVHRSRRSGDGSELPPYVPRDADADLEQALLRAAKKGGAVVVEGDSTAGKSRALLHALTRTLPKRALFAPAPEEDMSALADRLSARPVRKGAVVWLDDLHRYIGRGERGLTESVLAALVRSGVVVAATLRTERADHYGDVGPSSTGETAARVRGEREAGAALLRRFTRLNLHRLWSEAEVQRAADSGDGRLAEAAARHGEHGIAEYLAAGPELLRRWQDARRSTDQGGHPRGHAVVAAAVDLARTGLLTAPDAALLELSHTAYLDGTASLLPEPFDRALAWACKSVLGASGLLVAADLEARRWRAFDYLVDDTTGVIPPATWQAALDHAGDDERIDVAVNAYEAGHRDLATAALTPLADAGHPRAMNFMGFIAHDEGRAVDAETWYRRALDAGNTSALYNLGVLFEEQGQVAAAEGFYRRAVDAGHTHSLALLGVLLERRGEAAAAEDAFQRAVDAGHTRALAPLGLLLARRGEAAAAEDAFRRAVDAGDTDALALLGVLLERRGEAAEAEDAFRRAVDAGDTDALVLLGVLLERRGEAAAAEDAFQRAVDAGHTRALVPLGLLLEERGEVAEAEDAFQRALEAGHTERRRGWRAEAEKMYRQWRSGEGKSSGS
jgi:tetratricopeptide (TPR) repeat protein